MAEVLYHKGTLKLNNTYMTKTMKYILFIIASMFVILVFITSRDYSQLLLAVLMYPALVFFALKLFPRKSKTKKAAPSAVVKEVKNESKTPAGEIADIDKRTFIKYIAAAGISFFAFSLLSKRVGSVFLGNMGSGGGATIDGPVALKDVEGKQINPAQEQPTDGYAIAEVDDDLVSYYGFINKVGAWYIMRENTDTGAFRYSRGNRGFSSSWANRKGLKYDYYSNLFRSDL